MKNIAIILLIILPFGIFAEAPVFQQEQFPFPLSFYGVEPQLGFSNSWVYYHQDFADIDNDGDFDFFFGVGPYMVFMRNIGSPNQPHYVYITPQYISTISGNVTTSSPVFCDIDNDSDEDLFIGCFFGNIGFYQNIGTPDSAIFVLADSSFEEIQTNEQPIPDFVDIDTDGDYDLVIGSGEYPNDGHLYFYLNEGTPEIPNMVYQTDYFWNIDVGNDAAPEFCDIDADNDYDLFIGCGGGTVWYYENIGDSVNYNFQYVTYNYADCDVGNMSVPRFVDIDADEDYDLFVGNESVGFTNAMEGDFTFYENIGTASNPNMTFVTGQYLFMDLSSGTQPVCVDIDNDGLNELLAGIVGGPVILFENEGTQEEPVFVFADSSYLDTEWPYQPTMSFRDLDSDGDYDAVVSHGSFTDYVKLYINIGSPEEPSLSYYSTITQAPTPSTSYLGVDLIDIDNDADYDLFIAESNNRIQYWENIGNLNVPRFELVTENYFNQTPMSCYQYPRFGDMDHDGDFDLIVGYYNYTEDHYGINYWTNLGDAVNDSLVLTDTIRYWDSEELDGAIYPYLVDLDNDGDEDIFIGDPGGAMQFYRNLENPNQAQLTITIQDNDIILTWGSIADAVEYRIFYRDIPYFTPEGIPQAIILPPDTVWTDEGAGNLGVRFYRMVVEVE